MQMRFLLATDLTPASARMLRYVLELNRYFFARLELMHVFDLPIAAADEEGVLLRDYDAVTRAMEQDLWSFLREHQGAFHYDTTVSAVCGGLYKALASRATAWHADLIVTGHSARDRTGLWTSTGTGRHLLTHPPTPVLCVPEHAVLPPVIRNILVCTDLSEVPDPGRLQFIVRFAGGLNATIILLHVRVRDEIEWEQDEMVREAWKTSLNTSLKVLEHTDRSSLSQMLAEYASDHEVDMLVLFPHKHNWLDRLLLGSETGKLFDELGLPLMSLPMMD